MEASYNQRATQCPRGSSALGGGRCRGSRVVFWRRAHPSRGSGVTGKAGRKGSTCLKYTGRRVPSRPTQAYDGRWRSGARPCQPLCRPPWPERPVRMAARPATGAGVRGVSSTGGHASSRAAARHRDGASPAPPLHCRPPLCTPGGGAGWETAPRQRPPRPTPPAVSLAKSPTQSAPSGAAGRAWQRGRDSTATPTRRAHAADPPRFAPSGTAGSERTGAGRSGRAGGRGDADDPALPRQTVPPRAPPRPAPAVLRRGTEKTERPFRLPPRRACARRGPPRRARPADLVDDNDPPPRVGPAARLPSPVKTDGCGGRGGGWWWRRRRRRVSPSSVVSPLAKGASRTTGRQRCGEGGGGKGKMGQGSPGGGRSTPLAHLPPGRAPHIKRRAAAAPSGARAASVPPPRPVGRRHAAPVGTGRHAASPVGWTNGRARYRGHRGADVPQSRRGRQASSPPPRLPLGVAVDSTEGGRRGGQQRRTAVDFCMNERRYRKGVVPRLAAAVARGCALPGVVARRCACRLAASYRGDGIV